jgi:hypothetical protein
MALNDVLISPIAYLKIVMHTKRFWNTTIHEEKRNFTYGVLTGYVENGVRNVIDYIPLMHSKHEIDFEKKHSIFMKINNLNQDLAKLVNKDYIIGWVRSSNKEDAEITTVDKKNQLYIQTTYQKNAVLVVVLNNSLDYDWAISTWGYEGLISTLDQNSSLMINLNWEFDELENLDDLFTLLKDLNVANNTKRPIIKEFKEVLMGVSK